MISNNTIRVLVPVFLIFVFFADLHSQSKIDSLKQSLGSKTTQEKYVIYRQLVNLYGTIDPSEVTKYAGEALKIALQLNDENKIAESYHTIGNSKSREGKYAAALKNLNQALEIFKKHHDEKMIAYINNDIAWVNVGLKRYDVALSLYTQLLSFYSEKNNMDKYCSILNNMGTLLLEKEEYNKALEKFLKIVEIYSKLHPGDKGFMTVVYCNLGEAYFGLKDYGLSFKFRKMSLDIYTEAGDKDGIANLQMDLGATLIKLKDYSTAFKYLNDAQSNYKSMKFPEGIRKTKEKFVSLYLSVNQLNPALSACRELEVMCSHSKDSTMLIRCYNLYAEIYMAKDNYRLSADYYRKFILLKEEINSKENKQKLMELETVFETEQKEFENKTLRQENELQKEKLNSRENILTAVSAGIVFAGILLFVLYRKEKKIRMINAEITIKNQKLEEHIISKDKFFSIMAHNLKNPFWAILAQNKVLEESYYGLSEEERIELIKNIGSSASNVYKLFEDLLKWAKSQQNGIGFDKQILNISELIESSIKPYELIAKNKKVSLEISNRDNLRISGDKFMLETVIGNLVDNAIKYSNQNGEVLITCREIGDRTEISIQDKGIGLSREKIDKLFKIGEIVSSAGTMNEKGSGLGLIICKEFLDKHDGKIIIESREGGGTISKIILPNSISGQIQQPDMI